MHLNKINVFLLIRKTNPIMNNQLPRAKHAQKPLSIAPLSKNRIQDDHQVEIPPLEHFTCFTTHRIKIN